jgi:hypothetical protein
VPTITLEGDANGTSDAQQSADEAEFSGKYSHRTIEGGIGCNRPQNAPLARAQAIVDVDGAT